ncbi:MAG: hypothetical protein WEA09_04780 [Gemmatimonadota bacterium]
MIHHSLPMRAGAFCFATLLLAACSDGSSPSVPQADEFPTQLSEKKGGNGNASETAPVFFEDITDDGGSPLLTRFFFAAWNATSGAIDVCEVRPSLEVGRGNFRVAFPDGTFRVSANQQAANLQLRVRHIRDDGTTGEVIYRGEGRWKASLWYAYDDPIAQSGTARFLHGTSDVRGTDLVAIDGSGRTLDSAWCKLTRAAAGFEPTFWIAY